MTALTGCKQGENNFNEEKKQVYSEAFAKEFGAIDPNQDWNCARRAGINLTLARPASKVTVYGECGEGYYIVARRHNVSGLVTIGFDMPKGYDHLVIDIDGALYRAFADTSVKTDDLKPVSAGLVALHDQPMLWVLSVEDLDPINDWDFNDIVLGITHVDGETEALLYPLAVGSRERTYIYVTGSDGGANIIGDEYHRWLATSYLHMVNVYGEISVLRQPAVLNLDSDWTVSMVDGVSNMGNVGVYIYRGSDVTSDTQYLTAPTRRGQITNMVMTCGKWWWCAETYNIKDCYKDFGRWVTYSDDDNSLWYEHRSADPQRVIAWDLDLPEPQR